VLTRCALNSTLFFLILCTFFSISGVFINKVLQGLMTLLALLVSVGRDFKSVKKALPGFFSLYFRLHYLPHT
jgi:hypothetical protein